MLTLSINRGDALIIEEAIARNPKKCLLFNMDRRGSQSQAIPSEGVTKSMTPAT